MRLLIDSLIAMMLIGILAGVIFHHRQQQDLVRQYSIAHREFASLREAIAYHSALDQDSLNEFNHPEYPSPLWFPEGLPSNRLVPGRQPWFDIAPPGDLNDQPPDPVIHNNNQAGYWYNPNLGIVRARVMPLFTEQATLTLYNQINTTTLVSLPHSKDPERKPLPHPLLTGQLNADQFIARQTLMSRPKKLAPAGDEGQKHADIAHEGQESVPTFTNTVTKTFTLMSTAKPDKPAKPADPANTVEPVEPDKPVDVSLNDTPEPKLNTASEPARTKASLRSTTLLGDKPAEEAATQASIQSSVPTP